jgi:hypothetical protein
MEAKGRPRKEAQIYVLPIVSRNEARDRGEEKYFTGTPCVHGHVAPRSTFTGACVECQREQSRVCRRSQYLANPAEFTKYRRRKAAANQVGELLRRTRSRAKTKNLEFALTKTDLCVADVCPCCGHAMSVNIELSGSGNPHPHCPTADRFDSSIGYVPGNVHVICNSCNSIKRSATEEQLRMVANWMSYVQRQRLKLAVGEI